MIGDILVRIFFWFKRKTFCFYLILRILSEMNINKLTDRRNSSLAKLVRNFLLILKTLMYIFNTYVKWLWFNLRLLAENRIWVKFYHFWLINDGEKWSRKSIFEMATNGSHLKWEFAWRDFKKKSLWGMQCRYIW